MVTSASDYPWSSFQCNALGKQLKLITPHDTYLALGLSATARHLAYRALFEAHMSENTLSEIRETANKGWVLGGERFKQRVERRTKRRASSLGLGGDRKSELFKETVKP